MSKTKRLYTTPSTKLKEVDSDDTKSIVNKSSKVTPSLLTDYSRVHY